MFDVLSFDELQFDEKSSPFQQLKNTSKKIRRIVFSVIDVFYEIWCEVLFEMILKMFDT